MSSATITITSRNYGAWSLRGWLLCRLAGLDLVEEILDSDDPTARAELLLLAPSFQVPRLSFDGHEVWGALAIGEELHEHFPEAGLLPTDPAARAHCRSVCGEMHGGFANLRAALPMNIRARYRSFTVWSGVHADIERITSIWRDCLATYGGPYLFGERPGMADAMFAPVCTRFRTYGIELEARLDAYCERILTLPAMQEWIAAAEAEPEGIDELDMEF